MSSNVELSRELISLARQGGSTLRELREARRAAYEEAQEKAEKAAKAAGGKKVQKSQSTPTLTAAVTAKPSGGARRGGGWATQFGDPDLTKFKEKLGEVVSRGLDVDYRERPFWRTALWEATWKNHEGIVRLLASKGANVAAADFQGRTPLHEAAFYGHTSLLLFLLECGHPVDVKDTFGQTPLYRAAESGRVDIVRILVDRGAQTNLVDNDNCTVQHLAAFNGLIDLSNYLVQKGAVKNRLSLDSFRDLVAAGKISSSFSSSSRDLRTPFKAGASLLVGELRRVNKSRSALGLDLGA